MPPTPQPDWPHDFAVAVESIANAKLRTELAVREISAPANLAPNAFALAADVTPAAHGIDSDLGTGRFVVLHDVDEPEAWGGPLRVVCFAQAPLETEIGLDPFLADVAWAWLTDALSASHAQFHSASGTATKIISTGFGELAKQGDGAQIEVRASWTPQAGTSLGPHVEAWTELLCMLAGLPPSMEGVSLLSTRRSKRA